MALDFSRTLLLSAGRFSPLTGRDCPATPDPCPTVSPFLAELLGTAILIILGNGVVANVVLHRTKGQNSGWIVITDIGPDHAGVYHDRFRKVGDDWLIAVHAQPGAKCSEVAGLHGDALKVRIAAPPVDGKANIELIALVARHFGCAKAAVRIKSGASGRMKLVTVDD